ncbi:hypothetical protein AAMO2058_001651100 [Amorphochlora amoebiformis]
MPDQVPITVPLRTHLYVMLYSGLQPVPKTKFKKRKRKRTNVRERTVHDLEPTNSGVKIPQIISQLAKKRSKNALISSTSKAKDGSFKSSHLDVQKSSRSAMPAETADKHNSMEIKAPKRDKNKPKWVGPRKAPENIRMTTVIDYNPSLCKDYNETGFCGYGDSCKFLHDRGDYKGGWQLEKEWREKQEREKRLLTGEAVSDDENFEIGSDDELPFACHICREEFTDPVVTRCDHYFCEKCALQRYAKNKGCAICQEPTNGIFKTAHKLIQKLKNKREAEAALAEAKPEEDDVGDIPKDNNAEASTGWVIPGGDNRFKPHKVV